MMNNISDELISFGKKCNELGNFLETENRIYLKGYLNALEDVLNLPTKDFGGDVFDMIDELKRETLKELKQKGELWWIKIELNTILKKF